MKYIFFCLVSLVFLSSCAMPTTRHPNIPTVDSYDMKDVRRELRRYSYQLSTQRRQRLGEIAYNLRKSTGQEMCDRKLLADIGVDFMRINRLNVWKWSASYDALKEEHDDAQMLYGRNVGEVWIEGVYKGSAAEKAGVKKGDRLVSINGMLISKEDDNNEVFNIIYEQMYKSGNGIPIELELERNGKSKKYSFEPDMVCPYYIGVNDTSPDINAYATGDSIIMTARICVEFTLESWIVFWYLDAALPPFQPLVVYFCRMSPALFQNCKVVGTGMLYMILIPRAAASGPVNIGRKKIVSRSRPV